MKTTASDNPATWDVIVMGGALSGAATATLLLRHNPGIRVLILEKSARLGRRVGEATVEVSAYFMGKVLGLTQYLNESHIVKQGLRFWFANDEVKSIAEASELGSKYQVKLPSYQLDRSTFDEEVLRRACVAGATLVRPVTITSVQLEEGGQQTVVYRNGDATETVHARWIVDASGVAALIARKQGWWKSNFEHPTAAAWSRWKGVKDWDGIELATKYPEWAAALYCVRGTATNHVIGDGWWSWWIPLKGGDMSVGVVFDQRIVEWPQDGKIGDRLKDFLMKHPVGRDLLADAQYDESDVHWRKNLAYYSTTFAGDGFVLVGDAAAFMDPFYSPGMDWISYTTSSAANLITEQRRGDPMLKERLERYNHTFAISHRSWFEALYKDKYEYMGEFDLMDLAYRLDLGLYYWGVVVHPFRDGAKALLKPPFAPPDGRVVFTLMSTYNRRFAQIARRRRRMKALGKKNRNHRSLISGFKLHGSDAIRLFGMLAEWAWLEITEGWRSWGESAADVEASHLST